MSIKSILCPYSGEAAKGAALRHSIRIARHHNAYLTGVIRRGLPFLHRQFEGQVPSGVLEQLQENERKLLVEVADRFMAMATEGGLSGKAEFVDLDPRVDGPLTEFSRAFDLVVTGNHSHALHEDHLSANPDMIALKSGRPVLVVPDGYEADGLAQYAMLAWDGKRAATRALVAAMPVLADKARITLLSIGQRPRNTDRLIQTMQRHGVPAEAREVKAQGSIANTILAESRAMNAKLLVMGAFEHSKFSHDIMGGVTTDILRDTQVPVLMAH